MTDTKNAELTVDLLGPIELTIDAPIAYTLELQPPALVEIGVNIPLIDGSDEVTISSTPPTIIGYELWVDTSSDITQSGTDYFMHTQSVMSQDWVVVHNLLRKPSVQTTDAGDTQIFGTVQHVSDSQLSIHFARPITGKAYCI